MFEKTSHDPDSTPFKGGVVGLSPKSTYIPCLHGIRAVAFSLVLVAHSGYEKVIPGGLGVTIFFFLSGYLITTLLRYELLATGTISVRSFYFRRLLRLCPPLYSTIICVLIAVSIGVALGPIQWHAIGIACAYLTNYRSYLTSQVLPPGLGVLWSLAVEEHFYLFFPWLVLFFKRKRLSARQQGLCLLSICLAVLVWRLFLILVVRAPGGSDGRIYSYTDTRLDSIMFGCLLGICFNPLLDEIPSIFRINAHLFALSGITLLVGSLLCRYEIYRETFRYSIQGVAIGLVFFYVLLFPQRGATKWLEWSWVRRLGELSYTLYLIHYVILTELRIGRHLNRPLSLALGLLLSVGYAELSQVFLEQPIARFKRRLARKRTSESITEDSAISHGAPVLLAGRK